jgi:hypothetical protein
MTRECLLALALVSLRAGSAWAQGLPCPEFPVNTYMTGSQHLPALAADHAGNFVVVWRSSDQDGSLGGIFGQRFSAPGTPRGTEFQVNTYTTDDQFGSAVASDPLGNFVVVWDSRVQDAGGSGVFGQRFASEGPPQGTEFQVNTVTTGNQANPSVSADAGGNFVVVWTHMPDSGSDWDVRARQFSADGTPRGPDFRVNTYTADRQGNRPAVAVDPLGPFVVVWDSYGQDGSGWGVFGQLYDGAGVPQGPEFQVNSYTTGFQVAPAVAVGASGEFLVTWSGTGSSGLGIHGQRFDAAGSRLGDEFPVNTGPSTGAADRPAVTTDASEGYVVVWESEGADGSKRGVFGRRFSPGGVAIGTEFQVNAFTTGNQGHPVVAAGRGTPGFVVSWQGSQGEVHASLDCTRLYTVAPCRVVDTRHDQGPPLEANRTRLFPVTGRCNIPPEARAVVFNVTAVNPTEAGNLRLFSLEQFMVATSALNFAPGITRANSAVVSLGRDGQIVVQCDMVPGSQGSTNLVLDVFGYFMR